MYKKNNYKTNIKYNIFLKKHRIQNVKNFYERTVRNDIRKNSQFNVRVFWFIKIEKSIIFIL